MRRRRLITAFLACMLLFSCSLIPATATETPSNNIVMPRVSGRLDHSLPAKLITPITQPFFAAKGDTIKYDCTYPICLSPRKLILDILLQMACSTPFNVPVGVSTNRLNWM